MNGSMAATVPVETPSPSLGRWQCDRLNKTLTCAGSEAITAEPRLIALFEAFAANPGATLTKDALIQATWGHEHVADNSLNKAISDLRQILLRDSKQSVRIETVHKVGYRTVLVATGNEANAPLHSISGSEQATQATGSMTDSTSSRRSHWIALVWLPIAALSVLDFWTWHQGDFVWWRVLAQHAMIFLPWVLLGYGLGVIAPLLPGFGKQSSRRSLLFHAVASVSFMLMHSALHAASYWVALPPERLINASILGAWGECLTSWGALEVVAYWAILRFQSTPNS